MEQTSISSLSRSRKGIALPLVLGALTILSLLIFAIVSSSSNTYILNALVNHHSHARHITHAVMEEATLWIHEEFSNPLKSSKRREELLMAVFKPEEYSFELTGELHTLDILYGNKAGDLYANPDPGGAQAGIRIVDFDKVELREKHKAEVEFVKVRFHSFVPMRFHQSDLYTNPAAYYKDLFGFGGIPPLGDFIGFYTIHTKVKFGTVVREQMISRDFKIVNNAPIGGAYALFVTDVPSPSRQMSELNQGGKLIINAQNRGRIFVQGPLYLDAEGQPQGLQGQGPTGLSYPQFAGGGSGDWSGLSFVPSPRALTTCDFLSTKVVRPSKVSGMATYIGLPGGCVGMTLGDDAAQAKPDMQNYWAESVPYGQQSFSILGTPDSARLFKGHLFSADNKAPIGPFEGDVNQITDSTRARVEGGLIGNFHQINFQKRESCVPLSSIINFVGGLFAGGGTTSGASSTVGTGAMGTIASIPQVCMILYNSQSSGKIPAPYALGKYSPNLDRLEMVAGLITAGLQGLNASGNTNEGNNPLSVLGRGLTQMAESGAQAAVRQNRLSGGLGANDILPIPAIFPSNFKPFMRTASRKFPSLEAYMQSQGQTLNSNEILLDGNLWVDELVMKRAMSYRGVGTIASAHVPNSNIFKATADTPEIFGLKRADPLKDHLNLYYINAEEPESGKGMLKLKGEVIEASIYSYQGVKPEGTVAVLGNLVANVLNKVHIPQSSTLLVAFDANTFLQQDPRSQIPLRWYTISISPKISGMALTMNNRLTGTGDDGVKNFLESLDSPAPAPSTPTL
ncbi:MAG: hypothetical protein H3C47_00825 [Candidatus Cloacimonetes bacterium]|nr:hypothetical protein [Candidatus Cloacimonadota bacterium]